MSTELLSFLKEVINTIQKDQSKHYHPAKVIAVFLEKFYQNDDMDKALVLKSIVIENTHIYFPNKMDDVIGLIEGLKGTPLHVSTNINSIINEFFPEEDEKRDLYNGLQHAIDDFIVALTAATELQLVDGVKDVEFVKIPTPADIQAN